MEPNDEHIRKLTGNKNPEENYKMPDGYFDTFSSSVKEKIEARRQPQKAIGFRWMLRPVFSVPAVAIILMAVGYFVFFTSPTTDEQYTNVPVTTTDTADITIDEIEQYFASNVQLVGIEDEIDRDLLSYALELDGETPVQTANETITPAVKKDTTKEVSEEDIEEYLINNADDIYFENL